MCFVFKILRWHCLAPICSGLFEVGIRLCDCKYTFLFLSLQNFRHFFLNIVEIFA